MLKINNSNILTLGAMQLHEICCLSSAAHIKHCGSAFQCAEVSNPSIVWRFERGLATIEFSYGLEDSVLSYSRSVWVDSQGVINEFDIEDEPRCQALIAAAVRLEILIRFEGDFFDGPGIDVEAIH